jgi:hypothetical protein
MLTNHSIENSIEFERSVLEDHKPEYAVAVIEQNAAGIVTFMNDSESLTHTASLYENMHFMLLRV